MEYVNLGDVATYINGYAFKPEQRGKKGLPIIRIQDLNGNSHDLGFFDGEYPEQVEINTGDILISWSGSLGVYKWNKGKALLNQHIFKVLFNKIEIDKEYFCYAIRNSLSSMSQQTHGATMKHITKKDFDNISIPYPDLNVQRQIANNLERVNELIESYEKELILLEQLIKARFIEMFGNMILNPHKWEKFLLAELCDVRDGTHDSPKYHSKGYPLITSKNITGGKIKFSGCNLISKEDFDKINHRSKVDYGDILMPMIGTIGNPVIVDIKDEFAIKNVALVKLKKDSLVNNIFIKSLLESDYFYKTVIDKVRGGTQKFISLGDIRKLEICLPPIELQNQFADFVQQVDKSREEVKKSLEKTQQLYDSLMQEYFG